MISKFLYDKEDAIDLPDIKGHIQFKNVTFSYEGEQNALEDVSFEVQPGEMMGLAGHTGAGKTTLINLVCRFYDVNEGAILVDGHDTRDVKIDSLRSQIGVVLQNPFLFNGSVAENIAYGKPNATMREIGGGDFWWGGGRDKGKPGAGVNRYHRTTDSWNTYSKADGLADDILTTIAVGEEEVWFGTRNDGVSLYSKMDQTFVKSYTKTDVFSSDKINSIAVDGSQIWFGTANAGAQRYLRTVNTWVNYTADDGLASNHITWMTFTQEDGLASDAISSIAVADGQIWFGSDNGVSVYDKDSHDWIILTTSDGLNSDICVSIIIWVITPGVANFSLRGTTPVAKRRGEAAFQTKSLLLR